jgi:hypothetical protein
MKLYDVPPDLLERVTALRYDGMFDKHPGPWRWEEEFRYSPPLLIDLGGYRVLLPVDRDPDSHIEALRVIPSADGRVLTIFLKHTSISNSPDPKWDWLDVGRLAVCFKLDDTDIYVAHVYHDWLVLDQTLLD